MLLPTFFIIGAAKCGTTSLHAYLAAHPEISMSEPKEPEVFAGPGDPGPRLAEYATMLDAAAPVRGESSTTYSQHPRWVGAPERIREHVPEARFLYVVRDPIERAISHWGMHVAEGKEPRSLEVALGDFAEPFNPYISTSRYATQLRLYLEHFDAERFLVLDHSELRDAREASLRRVFSFLGVDPTFSSPRFEAEFNVAGDQRETTPLGRRLSGARVATAVRALPLPDSLRRSLRRIVSSPVRRPELDPALRERIAGALGDEVSWLRSFTGRSFDGWSI